MKTHTKKRPRFVQTILLPMVLVFSCSCGGDSQGVRKNSVVEIGEPVPEFVLQDTEGENHRLSDYIAENQMVVLEWFNPDCPYVRKHHETNKTFNNLFKEFSSRGVVFLAINSNGPRMQGHGLNRNRDAKIAYGIPYPVLLDPTGAVGRLYHAKKTPQIFIINRDGTLLYRGAIDSDKTETGIGDINYVAVALDQGLSNRTISVKKTKPYGSAVKYRLR